MNVNTVLFLIVLYAKSEIPDYLISFLPSSIGYRVVLRFVSFPLYLLLSNATRSGATMAFTICFCIPIWSQEALSHMNNSESGYDDDEVIQKYKQVRIIMTQYNRAMQILLPSAKFVTIVPAVLGGYAVVRLEGLVAIFSGISAVDTTCLLELVLSFLAEQDVRANELLFGLRGRLRGSRRSVLGKELTAARAIAVIVGNGSYHVDKELVLTVLEIIATNIVSVILL